MQIKQEYLIGALIALAIVGIVAMAPLPQGFIPQFFPALGMVYDGSASFPSLTWRDDQDTGVYRIGTGNVGISSNGTKVFDCSATACTSAVGLVAGSSLNMGNNVISNIGNAGTDFGSDGGLTLAAALNMSNAVINNIGNAGTDFTENGGLTANGGFTGTINTAAQTNITSLGTQAATLNMGNNPIVNVGNASTDFDSSGGLTTVYLTTTNNMSMNGATFSGPIKYGTQANYTQGASITHGFGTTPTVCIISPMQNISATFTLAETTFSTNMQSTSNPIYWMCGK